MAESNEQQEESPKVDKFEIKIDPKKDPQGNPITGFEGPMVSGDSTRKKLIEQGDDDE